MQLIFFGNYTFRKKKLEVKFYIK